MEDGLVKKVETLVEHYKCGRITYQQFYEDLIMLAEVEARKDHDQVAERQMWY